ncbi:glycosyltransferase family 9 protein [Georgenia thermotolerans]|uniref:Glycosyltransferase family 9 protein n=1 Tax=Georgenia thermotolerans TaxID=527326 RepID=A0A7J5UTQ0_9MICO|nr:glycosyltransferase family 9 protein [Georgenia thermotolerans]KAE8765640.1 glycosyltransferase family 9 protein [Georgenia thermotolerans]
MRLLGAPDGRPELLALRALKLGDLLVAVPAVHALRRAYPEHRLVLAVPGWLAEVVALVGGVDALLPTPGLDHPLPLAPGRVDVAADLHGGPASAALLTALAPRRRIAHRGHGVAEGPEWQDGVHERVRWARLVSAFGASADPDDVGLLPPPHPPVVAGAAVVHVGAFHGAREWPVERFAAVAAGLRAEGATVVLTGSARERDRALAVARRARLGEDAVLAGRQGLGELAALIHAAALVVSADTGAAHLASAYAVPSVVLFGPAPPEEWGPPAGGPHVVLTDAGARRGDTFAATPDPALLAVTAADVLAAARALLRPAPSRPPAGG